MLLFSLSTNIFKVISSFPLLPLFHPPPTDSLDSPFLSLPSSLFLILLVMFSFNKATYCQQRILRQLPLHRFISLRSRHGGHPAALSLACRFQSERRGSVRAGRQLPLPRHEAFVHVRLRLHLLLLHTFLPVSLARVLHLLRRCGLWPQSAAGWRPPDQHGLRQHAQLQDGSRHAQWVGLMGSTKTVVNSFVLIR